MKLISMDYIGQMQNARQLHQNVTPFWWMASVVLVILIIAMVLILKFMPFGMYRAASVALAFFLPLCLLQMFGLVHTNVKFHLLIGLFFSAVLALSDLIHTSLLNSFPTATTGHAAGYLSSLQYRHRFWTVMFRQSILVILTLFVTASFKILDTFNVVFGEGFVKWPLTGLLIIFIFWFVGVVIGILMPIRRHLHYLEDSMSEVD